MSTRRTLFAILLTALLGMGATTTCGPMVSITNPAPGTTYTSASTVTLSASTNPLIAQYGGTVTKVEFRDNGVLKRVDGTAPYTHAWSFTEADNGTHSWTAKVFVSLDATNSFDSEAVDVTVNIGGASAEPQLVGFVPTGGRARDVVIETRLLNGQLRDLAYVASDEFGLAIFDVTDPGNPVSVGASIPTFKGLNVALDGALAVVASGPGEGMNVVDVSDPTLPEPIGWLDASVRDVAITGQVAYARVSVAGSPAHTDLAVVDLSNPSQPSVVQQIFVAGGDRVERVGSYLYVTTGTALQIFSISNPLSPQSRGSVTIPNGANELAVAGNYAYVGNLTDLHVVDVSNPNSPVRRGSLAGLTFDLAAAGNRLYSVGSQFRVIDVSNPNAPVVLGSGDVFSAQGVEVVDDLAFLTSPSSNEGGLYLVDTTVPSAQSMLGHVPSGAGGGLGIAASGSLAVVASGLDGGLNVVDVSDPLRPEPIGWLDASARHAAMSGQVAYVRVSVSGSPAHTDLAVVDLSNPSQPSVVQQIFLPGGNRVERVGSYLYVTTGTALQIFSISNPLSPQSRGSVTIPNGADELAVAGNYAYVGNLTDLHVVDVSNPNSPVRRGSLAGLTFDLAAAGNRLYSVGSQFRVIDVSNPNAPVVLGSGDVFSAQGVEVVDDLAFLASPSTPGSVTVYDVSNPGAPQVVDQIRVPGRARDLSIAADLLFVSDEASFVDVFQLGP